MNWVQKNKIPLLLGSGLLLLICLAVIRFVIYKPHPTIENQKATFVGTVHRFQDAFKTDPAAYQDAVIQITGAVTNLDEWGAGLDGIIYGQWQDHEQNLQVSKGDRITVKGRFIGYDELLEEIKLDKCIIISN